MTSFKQNTTEKEQILFFTIAIFTDFCFLTVGWRNGALKTKKTSTTANVVPGESGHCIRPLHSPASSVPGKGSQTVVSYYLRYPEGFTSSQSSCGGCGTLATQPIQEECPVIHCTPL